MPATCTVLHEKESQPESAISLGFTEGFDRIRDMKQAISNPTVDGRQTPDKTVLGVADCGRYGSAAARALNNTTGGARTRNPRLRRPVLCPIELPSQEPEIVASWPWWRESAAIRRQVKLQLRGNPPTNPVYLLRHFDGVVPIGHYIYFLFLGDELVYIGETNNVLIRLGRHLESGKLFDSAMYVPCSCIDVRKGLECDLIRMFRPKLNTKWMAPRKPVRKSLRRPRGAGKGTR